MSRAPLPWRTVGLELVGCLPDRVRTEVSRRRRRVRTLSGLDELDAALAHAAELFPRDDDAARRYLSGIELEAPAMPADPFSEAYTTAVWDLYRRVSGRDDYTTANEQTDVDLDRCVARPYPYCTGSAGQVSDQLLACGYLIRRLDVGPGRRIVEFGPGWGNLTLPLAMMGAEVTAVEVSPTFAELLRRRAADQPNVTVTEADMLAFEAPEPFDLAVFFESFHHCSDHREMLRRLKSMVGPDGSLVFAAEPVTHLPYPWGLRLDGLSLWCTRTYGWLELGFEGAYFGEALARAGWSRVTRHRSRSLTPLADLIVARH